MQSSSSHEDSSVDEISVNTNSSSISASKENITKKFAFPSLFPTMKEIYGTELRPLSREDKLLYKRYFPVNNAPNSKFLFIIGMF